MAGTAAPGLTAPQADAVLQAVAATMRIVLTSPQTVVPGQPVTASLVPASPEIDASDLANGVLNLAMTAKDVLYGGTTVVDVPDAGDLQGDQVLSSATTITGNQPFPLPTPILNGGQTANPAGVLAQLFGTVAVPHLKVQCRIRWIVRDAAGNELFEGQDFVADGGLGEPQVLVRLPPAFRELRLDTITNPGGEVRCLAAEVTLTLGARTLGPFEVGPVPVLVLPLLIPTVVALYSQPSFGVTHDSAVLIVVPEHSPLTGLEPLVRTLRRVEAALDTVRSLGGIATFLLGLGDLLDTIPEQPRVRFAAVNRITDLEDYVIKRRPWWKILGDDPDFDDRIYSLLVVGLTGTRVEFFNDEDFKHKPQSKQGRFTLEVGLEGFVAIRTLDTDSTANPPVTLPPNRVDMTTFEPDTSSNNDGVWHTDMTSLRFDRAWLDIVGAEVKRPTTRPPLVCQTPDKPERPRPPRSVARKRSANKAASRRR